MWTPGIGELLVLMVIVLVVFGGGKLAGVGKSLGTAISEFKDAVTSDKEEEKPAERTENTSPENPTS